MTLPLDCTPLRNAVVRALTAATGKPRSLGLNPYLGKSPFFTELASASHVNVADVEAQPGVFVTVGDATGDPNGQPMEGGDRRREMRVVTIEYVAYAGGPKMIDEHLQASAIVERDTQRIIAALTCPGVLTDPAGVVDPVCDDGCLRWDGYSGKGPEWPRKQGDPRLVRVTHTFRTTVELSTPSA